ncbi:hypothetical protein AQUCO_01800248v1 [Aquilegia coerulea]|uniref:Uncharacterized protein n=1 Tax=Aquilegia coerulea TaxID=218851 RepID=A0A2G5DKQ6_AQUCA|nr:hypothetical protein AQUCO_01800248v1 [Aquilegia coerulea]
MSPFMLLFTSFMQFDVTPITNSFMISAITFSIDSHFSLSFHPFPPTSAPCLLPLCSSFPGFPRPSSNLLCLLHPCSRSVA